MTDIKSSTSRLEFKPSPVPQSLGKKRWWHIMYSFPKSWHHLTFRKKLLSILESPTGSPIGFWWHVYLSILLVASLVLPVIASVRDAAVSSSTSESVRAASITLERVVTGHLLVELALELALIGLKAFKGPLLWLKVLSVIPCLLEWSLEASLAADGAGARWLSAIAVVRVARLAFLCSLSPGLRYDTRLFAAALSRSAFPLAFLGAYLIFALLVFSTLTHVVETGTCALDATGRHWIDPSSGAPCATGFHSIPAAAWWAIVTLTTVGYGDAVPQTLVGRILGALLMLTTLVLLPLPMTIFTANLTELYLASRAKEEKALEAEAARLQSRASLFTLTEALSSSSSSSLITSVPVASTSVKDGPMTRRGSVSSSLPLPTAPSVAPEQLLLLFEKNQIELAALLSMMKKQQMNL